MQCFTVRTSRMKIAVRNKISKVHTKGSRKRKNSMKQNASQKSPGYLVAIDSHKVATYSHQDYTKTLKKP